MKGSWNLGLAALAMVVMCTAGAFAQPCGPGTVPGTVGDGCPDFVLDEATGILSFSDDGTPVQSILITGPDPTPAGLLNPDGNWPVAGDIQPDNTWTVLNLNPTPFRILTGTYAYFAGRYQNILFTDTANMGWTGDGIGIIQYPMGTRLADFGPSMNVEMSTFDNDPMNPPPSTTVFTDVVPEPAALSLLGIALLGLSGIRRR